MDAVPSRDDLASMYLDQLPYEPYPVQEEALLSWFSDVPGVLVCAPTGTGKTLIAEAAMFEALHRGETAYYTTPLIALTEQKFQELQEAAVRWGFSDDDVGLITGSRQVNPDAKLLVVVAEILLNRLLHASSFDFSQVASVVMDEFHSFNDPERGIVWELSLSMLPESTRLLLLSATVGNAVDFLGWLKRAHGRQVHLVQGNVRRVPLTYHWIPDQLLNEQIEEMSEGEDDRRMVPALIFCFNRNECWTVAEQLKGRNLITKARQKELVEELAKHDWSQGAGGKLKQILMRGVGVHHAGMLPKYRRVVENLFQRKLLAVTVCTETLAAGMNLPARSVLLTSLLKGPYGKKKVVEASSAHQMFGRAGRPQFDTEGHVYAIAHEDDVKILRWKEQYDQIPEDTKDPKLRQAKKRLKKKMPTRRSNEQYWTEQQFEKLQNAPPGNLASRGPLPWRLLAYLLTLSPDVIRLRSFVRKRLMDQKQIDNAEKDLSRRLVTLWRGDFVELEPEPPVPRYPHEERKNEEEAVEETPAEAESQMGLLGTLLTEANVTGSQPTEAEKQKKKEAKKDTGMPPGGTMDDYYPRIARANDSLQTLLEFRSVNPLYAIFLLEHMSKADENERLQLLESVLEVPPAIRKVMSVPPAEELPPGPLVIEYLHPELLARGLATEEELRGKTDSELRWENTPPMPLGDQIRLLFQSEYPSVRDFRTNAIWIAGDLRRFNGDFDKMVKSRDLTKQEGLIFRHLLRMALMCAEFAQVTPPNMTQDAWARELYALADELTESCRKIDPESTDKTIEAALQSADVVKGETEAKPEKTPSSFLEKWEEESFDAGLLDDGE